MMRRVYISTILAASMLACAAQAKAENADSVRLVKLELTVEKEIKAREALRSELTAQQQIIDSYAATIDSLGRATALNAANIEATAGKIGVEIEKTNTSLTAKADFTDVKTRTVWGVALLLILAVAGAAIYLLLHKRINRGNADVDALRQMAEKLNEDILSKFAQEMAEMQKISLSLSSIAGSKATQENAGPDHSLIKALADRITFMEMTLFKMDSKVKGFKQLSKSISQMKDNMLANGYEIVDMLGKPYNDGMKAVANFNDDEDIEPGKRIITAVIKPQINYRGQMIQAAQITVSQNV